MTLEDVISSEAEFKNYMVKNISMNASTVDALLIASFSYTEVRWLVWGGAF